MTPTFEVWSLNEDRKVLLFALYYFLLPSKSRLSRFHLRLAVEVAAEAEAEATSREVRILPPRDDVTGGGKYRRWFLVT